MKELTIKVSGSNTYKRTYFNSVVCRVPSERYGANLITPWGAAGRSYKGVEIEELSGGYDRGDGNHAWEASYMLRVRCPENAVIEIIGRQINGSSDFEILEEKVYA